MALSGFVGNADSTPINSNRPLAQLSLAVEFYFYKLRSLTPCVFTFSGFISCVHSKKYLEGSSLFLRVLLVVSYSDIFVGGSEVAR